MYIRSRLLACFFRLTAWLATASVVGLRAVVVALGAIEAPIADRALRVDPHGLLERLRRFVIPEVMQRVDPWLNHAWAPGVVVICMLTLRIPAIFCGVGSCSGGISAFISMTGMDMFICAVAVPEKPPKSKLEPRKERGRYEGKTGKDIEV